MTKSTFMLLMIALVMVVGALAQGNGAPIYHVTVIERSIEAVNYSYRAEPTSIGFIGTVLLPASKGEAIVKSRRGGTEIDVRFEKLPAAQRFGREYLTYVLWAVTPEGRPHNLGELVAGASDKAHVRVTTDLQAFGMIVTAEPYSAVRKPSDVVVLENKVRPGTVGIVKPIQAKYELLPRGQYVWDAPDRRGPATPYTEKVPMGRYETMLQLYEAQNAIGIAQQADAQRYAPDTLAKAQRLMDEAQRLTASQASEKRSVQIAREAIQTAEDARLIAEQRAQAELLAETRREAQTTVSQSKRQAEREMQNARNEADSARQIAARAQDDANRARAEAAAAQSRAESERIARQQMEAEVSRANAAMRERKERESIAAQRSALRASLLAQLGGAWPVLDTARGLVVTLPDVAFQRNVPRGNAYAELSRIARLLAAHTGLSIEVQGHSDTAQFERMSRERAESVRRILIRENFPLNAVVARSYGDSTPVVANTSTAGRLQNRRVEIVITGDPIGQSPLWDRSYLLSIR
ncbi:MAG: OmpA family protein [Acidobacteria bacterium]|nr:OmpA family protein [Acidobacteriota bacterium]